MAVGSVYGCAGFELGNALQSPSTPASLGCIDTLQQAVLKKKEENINFSLINIYSIIVERFWLVYN